MWKNSDETISEPAKAEMAHGQMRDILGPDAIPMKLEEERRMLRKMDLHIYPIVVSLLIMQFLDKVNIGVLFLFLLFIFRFLYRWINPD